MNPTDMLKTRPKAQIDEFQPGDTVTVNMVIREGDRTRVQAFQGNVIAGRYRDDKIPNPGCHLQSSSCLLRHRRGAHCSIPQSIARIRQGHSSRQGPTIPSVLPPRT